MKREEVNRCQIQEWYPKFKACSIKTQIIQLPESFVDYLLDDSGPFVLPVSVTDEDALPNRVRNPIDQEDYTLHDGSGDDDEESEHTPPSFPELELKVRDSIQSLGGAVFPKLNWSSPKDAAWISSTGSLRCISFSEIVLLLRSSDSLTHDLCHAYDSCSDKTLQRPQGFFLALRRWLGLRPEMEFRCFVKRQELVGISQREVTTFYPVLLEERDRLQALMEVFFEDRVRLNFESDDYVFDVYITSEGKVKIVDFNTWGGFTLPLLFSWEELEQNSLNTEGTDSERELKLEMRVVESRCGVRPGLKTAVPYDYVDTRPGSGWDQFMRNANEEMKRQNESAGG